MRRRIIYWISNYRWTEQGGGQMFLLFQLFPLCTLLYGLARFPVMDSSRRETNSITARQHNYSTVES